MRIASRWSLGVLAVFALARGVGCAEDDDINDVEDFREDVILCENAVARVEECCPDLRAPGDACVYRDVKRTRDCGACSGGAETYEERVEPVLAIATSEGILDTSCKDLTFAEGYLRLGVDLAKVNRWSARTRGCTESGRQF